MKNEVKGMFAALGIGTAVAAASAIAVVLSTFFIYDFSWVTIALSGLLCVAFAVILSYFRGKLRDRFDLQTLTYFVFANIPFVVLCLGLWTAANFARRSGVEFAGLAETLFAVNCSVTFAICLVGEFIGLGIESYKRKMYRG